MIALSIAVSEAARGIALRPERAAPLRPPPPHAGSSRTAPRPLRPARQSPDGRITRRESARPALVAPARGGRAAPRAASRRARAGRSSRARPASRATATATGRPSSDAGSRLLGGTRHFRGGASGLPGAEGRRPTLGLLAWV